ncbi:MAG TPA: CRTAC1 family protein [Actinophytocola sp.]|uniref:CRTAC1 family protein n=1 Tax=Actinophytocola sp. TaxID=1872138 RepID=UPI002DF96B2C|nr:CRTAC1 family protein [Actinophytocola sp.]
MTATLGWLRRHLPGVVAVVLVVGGYFVVSLPSVSAEEQNTMASKYKFTPLTIALPAANKQQQIRRVNKDYEHISAWISSVGAAIAMNDFDGDGLSNDICLVDTRTDEVAITPAPGKGGDRYAPFNLNPAPLPMNDVMAPMGCVPGDFNEDGRIDVLEYLWGRTPIVYLQKQNVSKLSADAFIPVELVPGNNSTNGKYTGTVWNTNSATVGDFDGDGHQDIFIGNYFPDGSPVLDDSKTGGVTMNHSMSHALNSGKKYILLSKDFSATTANFTLLDNALPGDSNYGWTLGSSATDLDGDLLPELYIANDFGYDRLLYNQSTPGHVKFAEVATSRTPDVPKSRRVGHDSFKGMGVDFGDLNHDGLYDMFVSNITVPWGIQESNFQFMSTAKDQADLRAQFNEGEAPYKDVSAEVSTAWSGWGWDVKIDDFNNSGENVIAQATGFVKGEVNRWPQLQELATSNDALVPNPYFWPNAKAGDDIGGSQTLHFFAKSPSGRYADIAPQLGLAIPVPTRGIAPADVDGDGLLDFAVARQYAEPVFYHNESPSPGSSLDLQLITEGSMAHAAEGSLGAPGSPATGTEVTVTTPDGRKFVNRVDGGSGHSGKRSHEVHVGLGNVSGPVSVHLAWRDSKGQTHQQDLQLSAGRHCVELGGQAKEMTK